MFAIATVWSKSYFQNGVTVLPVYTVEVVAWLYGSKNCHTIPLLHLGGLGSSVHPSSRTGLSTEGNGQLELPHHYCMGALGTEIAVHMGLEKQKPKMHAYTLHWGGKEEADIESIK